MYSRRFWSGWLLEDQLVGTWALCTSTSPLPSHRRQDPQFSRIGTPVVSLPNAGRYLYRSQTYTVRKQSPRIYALSNAYSVGDFHAHLPYRASVTINSNGDRRHCLDVNHIWMWTWKWTWRINIRCSKTLGKLVSFFKTSEKSDQKKIMITSFSSVCTMQTYSHFFYCRTLVTEFWSWNVFKKCHFSKSIYELETF